MLQYSCLLLSTNSSTIGHSGSTPLSDRCPCSQPVLVLIGMLLGSTGQVLVNDCPPSDQDTPHGVLPLSCSPRELVTHDRQVEPGVAVPQLEIMPQRVN